MLIDRITVYPMNIPFKMAFRHARKHASGAESLVVGIDAGTVTGYGEGAPRRYVTGEDLQSASTMVAALIDHPRFRWEIEHISDIQDIIESFGAVKSRNAALCALETALIDAFARTSGKPAIDFFPLDHRADTIHYGATIPLADTERTTRFCHRIKAGGIDSVRVKLGGNREKNESALLTVRRICGPACDIRVDINGAGDIQDFIAHLPLLSAAGVQTVEQPLPPGDPNLATAAVQAEREKMILMADEEACDINEVERIIHEGHYGIVNVRLSKCGGIHSSLSIIERLRRAGVQFQIGCQLGESGILSAAGRTLSLICADARYHDGSYDTFLLEENTTREDVSFGFGGEAHSLAGTGFGIEVDPVRLVNLTDGNSKIEIRRP
jgi:L-Ala-D/L-Glu epimerase